MKHQIVNKTTLLKRFLMPEIQSRLPKASNQFYKSSKANAKQPRNEEKRKERACMRENTAAAINYSVLS